MKKITLLLAFLITVMSFGQMNQIKTAPDASLICSSGGFGGTLVPLNYGGSKSGSYTGNSGVNDTWTHTTEITDVNDVFQKSEIIFQNNIPISQNVSSILSIISVTGGSTITDYALKIVAPDATDNDTDLAAICTVTGKKIRFSLVKQSNFVMGGAPIVVTLKASDLSTDPSYDETIIMTFNQPAILATGNLDNFNFTYGPNPAHDVINVSAAKSIETVEIFNFSGQKVIHQQLNAKNATVNITDLATGIYIMTVAIDGAKETYKIIKE